MNKINNKYINNNIYNNNQVCINNIHTYYNTISNHNNNLILYICLSKNFVYRYELLKFKFNDWNYYLSKLEKLGILKKYELNECEDNYLVWKEKTGRYQIEKTKYYTLTEEARVFLNKLEIYSVIKASISNEVNNYILSFNAKLKLTERKLKKTEKERINFEEIDMQLMGIENEYRIN